MCRAGGPRCNGSGRKTKDAAASTATAVAVEERPPAAGGSVPSREDADRLAAEMPADRTGWDGQPLNDAGRRLFALRESGYKGPIDQDGYPDTTSEGAGILRRMAHDRGEAVDW